MVLNKLDMWNDKSILFVTIKGQIHMSQSPQVCLSKFRKTKIPTSWLTCIKCNLTIWTQKLYLLTLTYHGILRKWIGWLMQTSSEDESTLSLFATSLLFWIPHELNGLIEKNGFDLFPILEFESWRWHLCTSRWLYSSVENNELIDKVNASTENREFLLDVEDILTRVE